MSITNTLTASTTILTNADSFPIDVESAGSYTTKKISGTGIFDGILNINNQTQFNSLINIATDRTYGISSTTTTHSGYSNIALESESLLMYFENRSYEYKVTLTVTDSFGGIEIVDVFVNFYYNPGDSNFTGTTPELIFNGHKPNWQTSIINYPILSTVTIAAGPGLRYFNLSVNVAAYASISCKWEKITKSF